MSPRLPRTSLAAAALVACAAPLLAQGMAPLAPGAVEGRPAAGQASPLQARLDAAAPFDTVIVGPGEYVGDLLIDKPLRLQGSGRPRLVGSGDGSVVRVRADDVTVLGFDIDGQRGGDLGRDTAAVHTTGARTTVRDCRVREALFGIYVREANGVVVEGCTIRGIPGRDPGEKGSGIHIFNTMGFRLIGNEVVDVRDGFYLQNASRGLVKDNVARDLRYGLHYMFSDDNVFEGNTFANGAAGTAIMYSRHLVFRRNRFLHNRGFASVGLLFQGCEDVLAEDNLIADNARGVFIEGSQRILVRRNRIAGSDVAVVLYDPTGGHRFEGNSFVGNLTPLDLVARRTDTVFVGNYWSGNDEPDLDGDGCSDRPYRLSTVFDHFRGNLTAADLMSESFAAVAIGAAERTFPVLRLVPVEDPAPLVRPPALPDVPEPDPRGRSGADPRGLLVSLALAVAGGLVLSRGWRR
ncbi:MAG TPA: nitrous oxide reductase family maturation protein NosD [Vicinamibacteria bacterium]|nr:nitrous oxide reductase family maturation protein NosD [Vicinamibacteria bacterium]